MNKRRLLLLLLLYEEIEENVISTTPAICRLGQTMLVKVSGGTGLMLKLVW